MCYLHAAAWLVLGSPRSVTAAWPKHANAALCAWCRTIRRFLVLGCVLIKKHLRLEQLLIEELACTMLHQSEHDLLTKVSLLAI